MTNRQTDRQIAALPRPLAALGEGKRARDERKVEDRKGEERGQGMAWEMKGGNEWRRDRKGQGRNGPPLLGSRLCSCDDTLGDGKRFRKWCGKSAVMGSIATVMPQKWVSKSALTPREITC